MKSDIPRGVFPKGRWFYLVTAQGTKRIWTKLSLIADGLPALYQALAREKESAAGVYTMPSLIATWQTEVMTARDEKTQRDDRARCKLVAEKLVEFTPSDVDAPACAEFLKRFKAKPRTFNAYRALLRELMRFAEEKGARPAGSNPVTALRTMKTPARDRYITDSELRRIKVAAMKWQPAADASRDTRSGPMLCALVDMAYLTGQAIGDLLDLEWSAFGADGILFKRSKVARSTGAKVLIEWTPKLRDVERRLKVLRKERRAFGSHVFCRQDGQPLSYWGASSAWQRARKRAGITDCTFHDLKAKALTDKEAREGMQAARKMGQHSTEQQTADYVRRRRGSKTGATR
jgi:integrase